MTKLKDDLNGNKEEFSKDKGASYLRVARFLIIY